MKRLIHYHVRSNCRHIKPTHVWHPWKSTRGSVLTLLLLIGLIIGGFHGYAQANIKTIEASEAKQDAAQMLASLTDAQKQNEALKEKLTASANIQTSNVQKELSRFWIAKYFGKDAPVAEKIFTCESNLQPLALNDKNTNGSSDLGIPQINSVHAKEMEKMYNIPFKVAAHDTQISIEYAKYLFDHQGFRPWVCAGVVSRQS